MRITAAAQWLGITPRMLRYRDDLGLLPVTRRSAAARPGRAAPVSVPATPVSPPATTGSAPASQTGHPAGRPRAATIPRPGTSRAGRGAARHRNFGPADLDAVAFGLAIERRYDISPAALAFGLRVLADPVARAQVAELGRRTGRVGPLPAALAMDFEKERARRLLS